MKANAYSADCPTRRILDRVGDKWAMLILLLLRGGVNAEMQRRNIPSTYTAQGRRATPSSRHLRPLSVSRSL